MQHENCIHPQGVVFMSATVGIWRARATEEVGRRLSRRGDGDAYKADRNIDYDYDPHRHQHDDLFLGTIEEMP